MKLQSGQTIPLRLAGLDQVELIEELGSGGNGHVWKVQRRAAAQQEFYVLKHIHLDPDLTPEQRDDYIQRIRREASVAVNSEYIIKCLGLVEPDAENFMILFPYTPGQDFAKWLSANRKRPWPDKKRIFLHLLDGVRALHQARIIHRDLKPKNIFITQQGEIPRILDFGLAKFRMKESVTDIGTIAGTDAYIAPEAFGWGGIKEVDERCDLYALGVILYEIIVGQNPWRANGWDFGEFARYLQAQDETGKSRYANILDIDTKFNFDDDPGVRDLIRLGTMFEPVRRFQTIDDFLRAAQSPTLGVPHPIPERVLPYSGDTGEIVRQALEHERQEQQQSNHLRLSKNQPGKRGPAGAPKKLLRRLVVGLLTVLVLVVGFVLARAGVQSAYQWWITRRVTPSGQTSPVATPQPAPTRRPVSRATATPRPPQRPSPMPHPTPRPTPSPTVRPKPSPTPKPQATPTRTPIQEINEQELRELLRRNL